MPESAPGLAAHSGRRCALWCARHLPPERFRLADVLRLSAEGYLIDTVVGDRGSVRLPPFDAVEIDLETIFPEISAKE